MTKSKISVLMTAYNREKYIESAIQSVLKQTYQNFELIVVDDVSTDRTFEIAKQFSKDPRVKIHQNPSNLGDYPNRNHALSLAQGDWIKYADSDDLMYPHCLEVVMRSMESQSEAKIGLSSDQAWPGGPCPMLLTPRMSYQREFLGYGMFMCGPSAGVFHREVLESLKGFPVKGLHSDYFFWLKACSLYSTLLLPANLFWYRIHPGQESFTFAAQRDLMTTFHAAWEMLHSAECPLEAREIEQAKRNQVYGLLKEVYWDIKKGYFQNSFKRLTESGLSLENWTRYLRPHKRSRDAGTPKDVRGDYLIPNF